jgi:hypothetical protein
MLSCLVLILGLGGYATGEAGYHRQWDSRLLNYANWEVSCGQLWRPCTSIIAAACVAHAVGVQSQMCPVRSVKLSQLHVLLLPWDG